MAAFHGMWTTLLAERYLPLPELPGGTYYDCVDGDLGMSRSGGSATSYAMGAVYCALRSSDCPYVVYPMTNVAFSPERWIQLDFAVVRRQARESIWMPADAVLIAGQIVNGHERVDRQELAAIGGIPYFLRARLEDDAADLFELIDGRYVMRATAAGGQLLESAAPFAIKFDPEVLRAR